MRIAVFILGALAGAAIYAVYRAKPWTLQRYTPRLDDYAGGMASPGWPERSR